MAIIKLSTLIRPGDAMAKSASSARRLGPGTTTSTPPTASRNGPRTPTSTLIGGEPIAQVSSKTRSGRDKDRSERSPISTSPSPIGSWSRTTSAAARDTRTCPPVASAMSRAARFSAGPK